MFCGCWGLNPGLISARQVLCHRATAARRKRDPARQNQHEAVIRSLTRPQSSPGNGPHTVQSHKIVWPSDSVEALVHVMYSDVRPMTTHTLRTDSHRLAMYYCFPGVLFGRQRPVGKGNSGRDSRARQRDVCAPNAITHQLSNLGKQLHSSGPPFHPLLV